MSTSRRHVLGGKRRAVGRGLLPLALASACVCAPFYFSTAEPPAPTAMTTAAAYDSREIAGFSIMIHRDFIAQNPTLLDRVLIQLHADLDEIAHLVPEPAAQSLRSVTVWVELHGGRELGHDGHGLCCHWSPGWLAEHHVVPEKVGGIEIINPDDYLTWRRDQPYMLFHEFAHAYHWRIGTHDGEIEKTYDAAMGKRLYDAVPRNSLPLGQTTKAYAATNDHEYFAELSEAYFAVNDFYPYTRAQLRAHDPEGFELIERLWNLNAAEIAASKQDREPSAPDNSK